MPDLLVNIDVADLERAVRFYTEGLGLQVTRRVGPDIAELGGASSPLYLIQCAAGSPAHVGADAGAAASREFQRHWTPVHLDFVVPDLDEGVRRAEQAGATVEGQVRDLSWGRYQVMADPFGNGFCLLEWKGRGYAEIG
jgi:predicted enzyme related to lactoylglutathione lyase